MKKSISLILASVLVLGSFVGCSTGTEEKEINHYFCPECTAECSTKDDALKHCAKEQKIYETSILALGAIVEQFDASEKAYNVKITNQKISQVNATSLIATLKEVKKDVLVDLDLSESTLEADVTVNYEIGCLHSLKLPMGMQEIKGHSFDEATNLTAIYLSDSVTTIAEYAFSQCKNLEKITFPSTVNEIGSSAFFNCLNLKEIELPEGITELKEDLFFSCENLKKIKLPSSLTAIGETAFFDCYNLKEIEIPASVTTIDFEPFQSCKNLVKVIFKNPEGWQRQKYEAPSILGEYTKSSDPAESLSKEDLSNPEKAAELLTKHVSNTKFKWTRTDK